MPQKPPLRLVSFKIDSDIGAMISQLPNRSAFVREAVLAMMEMLELPCPLCNGRGVLPVGLSRHYDPVLLDGSPETCDSRGA